MITEIKSVEAELRHLCIFARQQQSNRLPGWLSSLSICSNITDAEEDGTFKSPTADTWQYFPSWCSLLLLKYNKRLAWEFSLLCLVPDLSWQAGRLWYQWKTHISCFCSFFVSSQLSGFSEQSFVFSIALHKIVAFLPIGILITVYTSDNVVCVAHILHNKCFLSFWCCSCWVCCVFFWKW